MTAITSFTQFGLEFGTQLAERLAKQTGSANRIVRKLAIDGAKSPAVRKLAPNAEAPFLDVKYLTRLGNNSKGDYTVFNLRVRDGQKTLNNGIFSITENGQVIKYRTALGENGQKLRAHGYIDRNQHYDTNNWKYLAERNEDNLHFLATSGQQFRTDVQTSRNFIGETVNEVKTLGTNIASKAKTGLMSLV